MLFDVTGQMKLYECSSNTKRLKFYQHIPSVLGIGILAQTIFSCHSCFIVAYSGWKATKCVFYMILYIAWPTLFKPVYENADRVIEYMYLMEDGQNVKLKYINGNSQEIAIRRLQILD